MRSLISDLGRLLKHPHHSIEISAGDPPPSHSCDSVDRARTAIEQPNKTCAVQPDASNVDPSLTEIDGLPELTSRERALILPLMLSVLGAVDDPVSGLSAGAYNDLTRPFALTDLGARTGTLQFRPPQERDAILRVGPLELNLLSRTARRDDRSIDLLPREYRLLEYMMRHKDQLLTRAMLFEEVWHYNFVPKSNLVDVHMGRLRRKVDLPDQQPMIYSIRTKGFVLRTPA
jgi:two-component system OmpR family response regulator